MYINVFFFIIFKLLYLVLHHTYTRARVDVYFECFPVVIYKLNICIYIYIFVYVGSKSLLRQVSLNVR